MPTISILTENSLIECKPLAASMKREKLIEFAQSRYLNRPMGRLREPGAKVSISDLTEVMIREVELL